jgi:hypothetical protein
MSDTSKPYASDDQLRGQVAQLGAQNLATEVGAKVQQHHEANAAATVFHQEIVRLRELLERALELLRASEAERERLHAASAANGVAAPAENELEDQTALRPQAGRHPHTPPHADAVPAEPPAHLEDDEQFRLHQAARTQDVHTSPKAPRAERRRAQRHAKQAPEHGRLA